MVSWALIPNYPISRVNSKRKSLRLEKKSTLFLFHPVWLVICKIASIAGGIVRARKVLEEELRSCAENGGRDTMNFLTPSLFAWRPDHQHSHTRKNNSASYAGYLQDYFYANTMLSGRLFEDLRSTKVCTEKITWLEKSKLREFKWSDILLEGGPVQFEFKTKSGQESIPP